MTNNNFNRVKAQEGLLVLESTQDAGLPQDVGLALIGGGAFLLVLLLAFWTRKGPHVQTTNGNAVNRTVNRTVIHVHVDRPPDG